MGIYFSNHEHVKKENELKESNIEYVIRKIPFHKKVKSSILRKAKQLKSLIKAS